jgi:transposase
MADADAWQCLDEDTLPPLERLLPCDVYQALQEEIKRQRVAVPPASGLGIDHLNTIPANYEDALKKATILMDRTLRWRRLCFLYEVVERQARQRYLAIEKRNAQLERRHREDQQTIRRLLLRLKSLLKIPVTLPEEEADPEAASPESPMRAAPRKRGAPVGHRGNTRRVPAHVDIEETIPAPTVCPDCGHTHLAGLETVDDRYIEDIPPVLRVVTHRKYRQAFCPHCQSVVHHPDALHGPPVQTGPRLAAHFAQLRTRLGVTYRKLAEYSTEVLGIPLTASGALGILNRMADRLEPIYDGLAHALTVQRTLHGDETGWKMDGQRWQMWCFCNASLAFFHADKSRGSKVPLGLLGKDFAGLLHCDFYAAYNDFPNLQRCLIHFARDVHDERLITPEDSFLDVLHDNTQLITDAANTLRTGALSLATANRLQRDMHRALDAMTALEPPKSRALTLVTRLRKHRDSLLAFLKVPGAEFHNNRAERQLRPVVIFRKLSFGNRTQVGAHRFAAMASVIETARLQTLNLPDFLLRIRLAKATAFAPLAAELLNSS